jgi:hypothetical protein
MDGREVVPSNALQIDVLGHEFDRTHGSDDPPTDLVFAVANSVFVRLRTLARAQQIKPIAPRTSIWRMTYLRDDETEFEHEDGLYRRRNGAQFEWHALAIPPSLWEAAFTELPTNYQPPPWSTLILDAFSLLPEVGPAMVLASAAIETRIRSALDVLARQAGIDKAFWTWLMERGGAYFKEPSIGEQLDQVLRGIAGASLKDDNRLWEGYQNLRKARNSFAHEGRSSIGGVHVTRERAGELLALAQEIVEWIESLLPPEEHAPPVREWAQVQWERLMLAPE